jgi:hypothetical protein
MLICFLLLELADKNGVFELIDNNLVFAIFSFAYNIAIISVQLIN